MLSMIQVQVQHSFYQIFSHPLGKPCFTTLPDNIPFYQISPPWQPMLSMIQVQVQHSFYQIFPPPPLATHALRPYLTTFLLSNFLPPPWQPMLSMIKVQVQHSFLSNFFPPLGNPCFATLPDNIPFIKFSPSPLATFNDSSSSTTFLLSNFPPLPLATHALRPYLTTFLLSNFPLLGNPCFQWFKFKYNIPFIKFFPFALFRGYSGSSTTFLLSNFPPPPWQPMLCDPT